MVEEVPAASGAECATTSGDPQALQEKSVTVASTSIRLHWANWKRADAASTEAARITLHWQPVQEGSAAITGLAFSIGDELISGRSSGSSTLRSCTARPLVKEKRAASGPGT